jgi:hypothetical protein
MTNKIKCNSGHLQLLKTLKMVQQTKSNGNGQRRNGAVPPRRGGPRNAVRLCRGFVEAWGLRSGYSPQLPEPPPSTSEEARGNRTTTTEPLGCLN